MGKEDKGSGSLQSYTKANWPKSFSDQMNFMYLVPDPEFNIVGSPTRTILQFFDEDFVSTVRVIRKLYLPFKIQDQVGDDLLTAGYEWVQKNTKEFEEASLKSDPSKLPIEVLIFYLTLHFPVAFMPRGVRRFDPENNVPVAFNPNEESFRPDIHRLTLPFYDKLKFMPGEHGKKLNPETYSTSRSLRLIKQFFRSGGEGIESLESADVLTYGLIQNYWIKLRLRAKATEVSPTTAP